jgi:hypothetical protein
MASTILSHNSSDAKNAKPIWHSWWEAVALLQPAFTHAATFYWFAVVVAGMMVRTDKLGGLTSIMRALKLKPCFYSALVRNVHSNAVQLEDLSALWSKIVMRLFPSPLRVNERRVLVGDGIKVAKRGKKMPGVKLLHQQSENKAEFTMGHSCQAISVLVHAAQSVFAVPLSIRIHEGIVFSNRCKQTLLDKMLTLIDSVSDGKRCYFVADAYYAARPIAVGLRKRGSDVVTRVKHNTVANEIYHHDGAKKRGRPRKYGDRVVLRSLFDDHASMKELTCNLYGERDVEVSYAVRDLYWKPTGLIVRFVAVTHPTRGSCLLMSTDVTLSAVEIIQLYGLRFKIEYSFKQAVHQIGSFAYRFWMKSMKPQRYGAGNQYLHRESAEYREEIKRKIHAYHVFLQAGIVAQGLMQYLSVVYPQAIWESFGSWLRTIRPGIAPSEFVVSEALRQSLPHFLLSSANTHAFAKFVTQRQNIDEREMFQTAA